MSETALSEPRRYKPTLLYRFLEYVFVPAVMATWVRTDVQGRENIPASGPFIVVSNHVDNNDSYLSLIHI